jgi:hypothetical protein
LRSRMRGSARRWSHDLNSLMAFATNPFYQTYMLGLGSGMAILPEHFAEINSCEYLFLREISEPEENRLRLLLEEARASGIPTSMIVAGVEIKDCRSVLSTDTSRLFEINWDTYIAYSVRDESYAVRDKYDQAEWGERVCIYSKSRFLDYVSQETFACAEHPGPFQHIGVACENHIIDIISTHSPRVQRLRPAETR